MDPELLRQMMEDVQVLRQAGRSDREINSILRGRRDVPINSVTELEAEFQFQARQGAFDQPDLEGAAAVRSDAARVGNTPAPQPDPLPFGQQARALLTDAANAFYGGLGDDVVGLVSPRGQAGINRQVDISRQQNPLLSFGAEMGTMAVGAPGRTAARLLPVLGRAGGRVGARAGAGVAQRLGGGELAQLTGSGIGRTVGTGVGAGIAGAGEGGLVGFGETRPGEDRATGTKIGAGLGLVAGGGTGLVAGAGGAARNVSRIQHEGGEHLADALTESGGLLGTQSVTQARGRLRQQAAAAHREAAGEFFPPENLLIRGEDGSSVVDPAVRRVLRRSGTDESRSLLGRLESYAAGESIEPITVGDVDRIRKQVNKQATAGQRALPDALADDEFRIAEAGRAINLIDEGLEGIPAYTQRQRLSARQNALRRAGASGSQLRQANAQTLEAALRGEQVHLPGSKRPIQLNTQAERIAAREAIAEPMVNKLRGGPDSVRGFLNDVFGSSDTRRKLQLIFGDDSAAWEQFLAEARQVRAINDANRFQQFGTKYASFMLLGSSVLADPIQGLLGIGD